VFNQVIQTKEVGGNPDYYLSTTTTTLYALKSFGGLLSTVSLKNDHATDPIQFSWDGATLAGDVKAGESVKIHIDQRTGIYVKSTAGGAAFRLWGWNSLSSLSIGSGSGTPGGSDTQVQFNDGGVFGGDADFTWNKTTNILTAGTVRPVTDNLYDLGTSISSYRELFVDNDGGVGIAFPTARGTGAGTNYTINVGGGSVAADGAIVNNFTLLFDDVDVGSTGQNNVIIALGGSDVIGAAPGNSLQINSDIGGSIGVVAFSTVLDASLFAPTISWSLSESGLAVGLDLDLDNSTTAVGNPSAGFGSTGKDITYSLNGVKFMRAGTHNTLEFMSFDLPYSLTLNAANYYFLHIKDTFAMVISSGARTTRAQVVIEPPNISITGGSLVNGVSLYVVNAPTEATNNYAIWSDAGFNRLDGNSVFGGTVLPTAKIHIAAGTTAASTAPIKLTSGSLMTASEVGAFEFLTDDIYWTITTGAARKIITLNDIALTSGRVPFVTTNGRLTDDSDMTFATDTLTVTKLVVGGGATLTQITAGTYTPTRSAETNLDANVTMTEAQFMRVGATVTVSGRFTADPTLTATATSFEITLPVASNIGAVEDAAGVAFCGAIAGMGAEIIGVVVNDTAKIQWVASDITSQTWSYTFTYQVI